MGIVIYSLHYIWNNAVQISFSIVLNVPFAELTAAIAAFFVFQLHANLAILVILPIKEVK